MVTEIPFQNMLFALEMHYQAKVKLIMSGESEALNQFQKIPHTWYACLNQNLSKKEGIFRIWQELNYIPADLLNHFSKKAYGVGLVASGNHKSIIGLSYIFRQEEKSKLFYSSWIGGPPATHADFQEFHELSNIQLPQSYVEFCKVHNGFIQNGNLSLGFSPIRELNLQQQWMPFYEDGFGNARGYNLNQPTENGDFMTYDWDHESKEFSNPQTFWEFVTEFFSTRFGGL